MQSETRPNADTNGDRRSNGQPGEADRAAAAKYPPTERP